MNIIKSRIFSLRSISHSYLSPLCHKTHLTYSFGTLKPVLFSRRHFKCQISWHLSQSRIIESAPCKNQNIAQPEELGGLERGLLGELPSELFRAYLLYMRKGKMSSRYMVSQYSPSYKEADRVALFQVEGFQDT